MKTLFWQRKLAIAYANPCKVWLVHPELCQINDPHQPILPKFSQLCLNQGQAQLTFLEYPCMFFRTLLLHSMCTIVAHYEGSCCTSVVAQKYICNFPLKILDWSQTTSCKNRHQLHFFSSLMMMMHQKLFSVVLQISAHHCSLLLLLCACCNAEVRTFCEKNAHCRHKFILFEDEDDGKRPLFVFKKPI